MTSLIQQYRQVENYFFRNISKKYFTFDQEAIAYMTGVQVDNLNIVYIKRKPNNLEDILTKSKHFFEEDNLNHIVVMPEEHTDIKMEKILKIMGYEQSDKSVSMRLNLKDIDFEHGIDRDKIKTIVENNDNLTEWMLPLVGAFESTVEICSQYKAAHECALKNNAHLRHFSLYEQAKPMASITLSIDNNIARIDDVGTLPEHQGKGLATKLMKYVLAEAKIAGATVCFLEASDSGFSIYEKLGFKTLFKNYIFSRDTKENKL